MQIRWLKGHQAGSFDIFLSDDGNRWDKAYSVSSNMGDVSFVRLPEAEARYLRLELTGPADAGTFGIREIGIPGYREAP